MFSVTELAHESCRCRWLNHLNPSVKKGPWAIEEEETLIHGHR